MRVYVESNFVLELVLRQEQCDACNELVRQAEERDLVLTVPAFCLFEPYTTIRRRSSDFTSLQEQLQKTLKLIARTPAFKEEATETTVPALLVRSAQDAAENFDSVLKRLSRTARILPLDTDTVVAAQPLQTSYGLTFPDALVLASVLRDLDAEPAASCFLNRNTKDFDDPTIVGDLSARNCRLVGSFNAGLEYVAAELRKRPASEKSATPPAA